MDSVTGILGVSVDVHLFVFGQGEALERAAVSSACGKVVWGGRDLTSSRVCGVGEWGILG